MKATQAWIEDAIKGGWFPRGDRRFKMSSIWRESTNDTVHVNFATDSFVTSFPVSQILLDPLAWEAMERWLATKEGNAVLDTTIKLAARHDFNKFGIALWEGKTIEEALQALT